MTLVAVSKTVPPEALRDAVAAGLDLLGENRVQEAAAKVPQVPGARWHLVGPLQSNKAHPALAVFDEIESVDSVKLAMRLDRLVPEARPGRRYPVLVEVNVDKDPAKAGFAPDTVDAAMAELLEPATSPGARAHDGRSIHLRPRSGPATSSPCARSRIDAAHAGPSSARSCRWG